MSDQWILNKLDELKQILLEYLDESDDVSSGEEKDDRFNELVCEVMVSMIEKPGVLLYIKEESKRNHYKALIELVWKFVDPEKIYQSLSDENYETLHFIAEGLSKRVVKLKPTVVSVDPKYSEFTSYLDEAISAWLHGLDNASLILCFSVLENIIKDKLCKINIDYVYELNNPSDPYGVKSFSFDAIIKNAYREKLISKKQKNALFRIKKKRNSSVHNMTSISSTEAYEIIQETKEIIECLLSE